jgi:hypothetical protein
MCECYPKSPVSAVAGSLRQRIPGCSEGPLMSTGVTVLLQRPEVQRVSMVPPSDFLAGPSPLHVGTEAGSHC